MMIGLAVLCRRVHRHPDRRLVPAVVLVLGRHFPARVRGLEELPGTIADGPVLKSFGVTIGMALAIVVLQLLVGLVLAVLVNQRKMIWLRTIFRTAFYLPCWPRPQQCPSSWGTCSTISSVS